MSKDVKFRFSDENAEDVLKALKQLTDAVEGLETATGDGGKAAEKAESDWKDYAIALNQARDLAKSVYEKLQQVVGVLIDHADAMERAIGISGNFAGSTEEATRRTGGLVSQLDLMRIRNRAALAGLQLTDRQLANLAVAAGRFAESEGEDLTQAIERFAEAVSTSPTELNKLGVSLEGVSGLAEQQRVALEQLEQLYGTNTVGASSLGGGVQELRTALEDFKLETYEAIASSEELNFEVRELADSVADLGATLVGADENTATWSDTVDFTTGLLSTMTRQIDNQVEAIRTLINVQRELATGNIIGAAAAFGEHADRVRDQASRRVRGRRFNMMENLEPARGGGFRFDLDRQPPRTGGGGGGGQRGIDHLRARMERAELDDPFFGNQNVQAFGGGERVDVNELRAESMERFADAAERSLRITNDINDKEQERLRILEEERALREEINGIIEGASAIGSQVLELFGADKATMNLWDGITEEARAVASAAQYDFWAAAQHQLAAALHFKAASEIGGGRGARSSSGGAAAGRAPAAPPGQQAQGGGGVNVTVNYNAPISEPLVGRMQRRAAGAMERRIGTS